MRCNVGDVELVAFGKAAEQLKHVVELHTSSQGFIFAFGSEDERQRFIKMLLGMLFNTAPLLLSQV